MADILLSKPAANAARVVPSAPDSRFVFDFPANTATLSRAGDSLLLTFDGGSSIELTNFYPQYSQKAMPEFVIDGTLVAGADFFNAFGPDLMPDGGSDTPNGGAGNDIIAYDHPTAALVDDGDGINFFVGDRATALLKNAHG